MTMNLKSWPAFTFALVALQGFTYPGRAQTPPPMHEPQPLKLALSDMAGELANDAAMGDVHIGLTYATVDGKPLLLDLVVPKSAAKPVPLLIWFHGGGMRAGTRTGSRVRILPLIPLGYAVATVDYRLAPGTIWPGQLYDCKAAIRWLRAHAAQYGYDPNRIGIGGDSAGGTLVAMLGTTGDKPEFEGSEGTPGVSSAVQVVIDYFGGSDFTDESSHPTDQKLQSIALWLGASPKDDPVKAKSASAVYHVDAKTPPFFLAHGSADNNSPMQQSLDMDAALKKAGIPDELYLIRGAPHEFRDQGATDAMIAFLNQYLKPGKP
jgi:acetyl esterase/lipase